MCVWLVLLTTYIQHTITLINILAMYVVFSLFPDLTTCTNMFTKYNIPYTTHTYYSYDDKYSCVSLIFFYLRDQNSNNHTLARLTCYQCWWFNLIDDHTQVRIRTCIIVIITLTNLLILRTFDFDSDFDRVYKLQKKEKFPKWNNSESLNINNNYYYEAINIVISFGVAFNSIL